MFERVATAVMYILVFGSICIGGGWLAYWCAKNFPLGEDIFAFSLIMLVVFLLCYLLAPLIKGALLIVGSVVGLVAVVGHNLILWIDRVRRKIDRD